MHYEWFRELHRVLQKGGVMLQTTQGNNFIPKLTPKELNDYNAGKIVVSGHVKEGHRTYSAFHPKGFMNTLFKDVEILEHIVQEPIKGRWLPQDLWIIKKK
jgi:hypothetical protein